MILLRRDGSPKPLRVLAVDVRAHQAYVAWRFLLGSERMGHGFSSEWYDLPVLVAAGWYPQRLAKQPSLRRTEAQRTYLLRLVAFALTIEHSPRDGEWYYVRQTRHSGRHVEDKGFRALRLMLPGRGYERGLKIVWRWDEGLCYRWAKDARPVTFLPKYILRVIAKVQQNRRLLVALKRVEVQD